MKTEITMNIKTFIGFLIIVVCSSIFFTFPKPAFASTLSLSPGSGNVSVGGTISVQIRLNAGGDAVNGISAFLSYPADKLNVAWVSPGSAFAIAAENSYSGGIIKVSRGSLSGVTGNVNVATIGFKGKSVGQATVSFIGGSAAPRASDSSDSLNLGGSRGGTYNVITGSALPKTVPTTDPKNAASSSNTQQQILISDLNVTSIASGSATISWKTDVAADSLVEYGLDKDKYFLNAANEQLVTDHQIILENPMILPGYKFHFLVKSKDSSGNIAQGVDQEFQVPGFQVKVKVVDEMDKPLSGVEVWLYSDPLKAITDINGEAVFENTTEGKHLAVVKVSGSEKTAEINVLGTNIPQQGNNITIKVSPVPKKDITIKQSQWITFFVVVFAAAIVILVVMMVIAKKKTKMGENEYK